MSWVEILGFVTGALSVILAVRESVWNWPLGIANNIFFFLLFWKVRLYADAVLQIVYVVISVYGWWNWLRGGEAHSRLSISFVRRGAAVLVLVATALATALMALILQKYTDSKVPFWDGLTTALSLAAQYMLCKKWIENWFVWMTADVVYIGLYWYKALYLTGVLYAIFLGLCVAGFIGWRRVLVSNSSIPEPVQ